MDKSDIDALLKDTEQDDSANASPTQITIRTPSVARITKAPTTGSHDSRLHTRSCTTCYRRKVKCDKVLTGCSRCSKAGIPCVFPPRRGASQTQDEDELRTRLKSLEKIVQELLRRDEMQKNEKTSQLEDHGMDEDPAQVAVLSPPESEKGSNPNTDCPVLKNGRLVTVDGRSSYLTSSFWIDLNEEVEGLRDLVEGLQDNAETPESLITESHEIESQAPFTTNQGFFFNFSSLAIDLQPLMPKPEHVPLYWQIFTTNVNPLLRILHVPSVQNAFMSAQFGLDGINKASQALIFAICFAAAASMSPENVISQFEEKKDDLLQRLRFAVEQALARADFMGTNDFITLQALVLFLNCICRQDDDSRVLYTMTGVAVRLAQLQGLHRDGTLFGLSPFETEMRRRLWWNICTLDQRASEEQGSTPLIWDGNFDTKMPLNIDDSDIDPDSTSFPEPRISATDMSFALLRVEHWKAYRQFHKSSTVPEQLSQEDAARSIEDKKRLLENIKEHFENTYLRHFDTAIPFYWLVTTFTRLSFEKMALLIYHPFHTTKDNPLLPKEVRDRLFISCTNIIGYSRVVEISPFVSQWAWFFRIYVQRNAVAYVLTELCIRPSSKEVDRAWEAIDFVFNWWSPAVKRTTDGVVWRPLKKLLGRALKVREANLSLRSQQLSSTSLNTQAALPRLQGTSQGHQVDISLNPHDTGLDAHNTQYGEDLISSKPEPLDQTIFGGLAAFDVDSNLNYAIPPEDIGNYLDIYSAEGGFDLEGWDQEEQNLLRDSYF
ncbi:fungal-specific transcription factor domain-containing protein [Xylogone sp. PMI_703]|nr:fungal-specific transcription factor domain-containing protein [Xylogone sp. PMI_703]